MLLRLYRSLTVLKMFIHVQMEQLECKGQDVWTQVEPELE